MAKELKIGVIGCGKIAESSHLPALLNTPGARISWLFDKDPVRSDLLSRMYGLPVVSADEFERRVEEVDVCLLTVPYGARREYIDRCAASGKALYVEKPFAVTHQEHLGYCNRFPAHKLAIGFQRRYYQTIHTVKAIVEREVFGKLESLDFQQGYFQLKGGGGFMSDAGMSGGGVIIESAIHSLDLILQLTAASAVDVRSAKGIIKNGIDYDTTFVSDIYSEGRTIEARCHVSCLRNLENGITLNFENASLHFQPAPAGDISVRSGKGEVLHISEVVSLPPGEKCSSTVAGSFLLFWSDFIRAISTAKTNKTNGHTSLITTHWVEQVYQHLGSR